MICDSCKQAMTPQYRVGDWKHIAWACYQCMRRERIVIRCSDASEGE